jgi:hypothetical protein
VSGWNVTGSRDCVRIVRPGGIVVITLDARAGEAVFEGLKTIYGESADARANLARIRPAWWRRALVWLRFRRMTA